MTRIVAPILISAVAIGLSVACADTGENTGAGGPAMVISENSNAVYVASADDNLVARVDTDSLDVSTTPVSGEPSRVARIGNRVFVTLRAERALLELADDGNTLTPVRRIEVGAEPFGVVASGDGANIYVAVSLAGQVVELDGTSLEKKRAWSVPAEPRWLALHPSGGMLYVGGTAVGGVYTIDLERDSITKVAIPPVEDSSPGTIGSFVRAGRVTGDPAVSPNGRFVAFPMLFVDNITPIVESDMPDPNKPHTPPDGSYGGRMTPTIVLIPVDHDGTPDAQGRDAVGLSSIRANGYASSIAFTMDSRFLVATIEGAEHIVLMDTLAYGSAGIVASRPTLVLRTSAGPRSVVLTKDRGFVFSFLDRRVGRFSLVENVPSYAGPVDFSTSYVTDDAKLTDAHLPLEVELGRRLFYTTTDPAVSDGSVSCATCHFDGRTDGLTWSFDRGPRQTPSLAGMVSLREPLRWSGDSLTVADDAMKVTRGLMGGGGVSSDSARAIAAFVDYTRAVDLPMKGQQSDEIELGRALFNRPDVACATCHSGPLYSDKRRHDMLGFDGVKTPSLLGVAATAPYFHDGSAADLRDVLDASRSGFMGNTSGLDEREMDALEAFLRTL